MILLDTDVLIAIGLDRRPHSVSNFYDIAAPVRGGVSARDFIVEQTRFVATATTDTAAIRYAAELPMYDENQTRGNVRELWLKAKVVRLVNEADEDITGPASLVALDPDGNPVLVDQYVW